jgi:hypothetical protein
MKVRKNIHQSFANIKIIPYVCIAFEVPAQINPFGYPKIARMS